MSCCPGCHHDDCPGVIDQAAKRAAEWLARKKYSPTGASPEVAAAIEEMVADMKAGDVRRKALRLKGWKGK